MKILNKNRKWFIIFIEGDQWRHMLLTTRPDG